MSTLRGVIRLYDQTSHGGFVIRASGSRYDGKPLALLGDLVACPLPGHGVNPIIEGEPTMTEHGKPVALHGHRTACGCTLISSLPETGVQ